MRSGSGGRGRSRRLTGPDGRPPLAEVVAHGPVLSPVHERLAEPADDGRIDAGGHQPERMASGDEAVARPQVLEPALYDADIRQAGDSLPERDAHGVIGVDQPQTFEHPVTSPTLNDRTQPPGRLA